MKTFIEELDELLEKHNVYLEFNKSRLNKGVLIIPNKELCELIESEKNGRYYFDSYQDIDLFLMDELYNIGVDFPLNNNINFGMTRDEEFKGSTENTINAIKLLIENARK